VEAETHGSAMPFRSLHGGPVRMTTVAGEGQPVVQL
jgi:hypothetical protein